MIEQCAKIQYTLGYSDEIVDKLRTRRISQEGAFLLPYLRPGQALLDVGCGPGSMTQELAKIIGPGIATGIDISADQVAAATAQATKAGIENIRFKTGDIYNLPVPDETYDIVFVHAVLLHLNEPHRALEECFRILKSGGYIGIRDGLGSFDQCANLSPNRIATLMKNVLSANRCTPDIGLKLKRLLIDTGFEHLAISTDTVIYDSPEDLAMLDDWYRTLLQGEFGKQAVQLGVIENAQLNIVIDSLKQWPLHPGGLSIVEWIQYISRKP